MTTTTPTGNTPAPAGMKINKRHPLHWGEYESMWQAPSEQAMVDATCKVTALGVQILGGLSELQNWQEPYFSDVTAQDVANRIGQDVKSVRGALAQLANMGLVNNDDMNGHTFQHLSELGWAVAYTLKGVPQFLPETPAAKPAEQAAAVAQAEQAFTAAAQSSTLDLGDATGAALLNALKRVEALGGSLPLHPTRAGQPVEGLAWHATRKTWAWFGMAVTRAQVAAQLA